MHAANILKNASADAKVAIDFRTVFEQTSTVNITIWHNTGDECGPPCYYLHQFLAEMADVAELLAPGALRAAYCACCEHSV